MNAFRKLLFRPHEFLTQFDSWPLIFKLRSSSCTDHLLPDFGPRELLDSTFPISFALDVLRGGIVSSPKCPCSFMSHLKTRPPNIYVLLVTDCHTFHQQDKCFHKSIKCLGLCLCESRDGCFGSPRTQRGRISASVRIWWSVDRPSFESMCP